jgi:hypothetical protein
MDGLRNLLTFPEHHASLAWWITILLASAPAWRFVKLLLGWGTKFQQNQRAIKLRILKRLHGDSFALNLYLARESTEIAVESATTFIIIAIVSRTTTPPIGPSLLLFLCTLNIALSVIGRGWRVRGILNGLADYEATSDRLQKAITR